MSGAGSSSDTTGYTTNHSMWWGKAKWNVMEISHISIEKAGFNKIRKLSNHEKCCKSHIESNQRFILHPSISNLLAVAKSPLSKNASPSSIACSKTGKSLNPAWALSGSNLNWNKVYLGPLLTENKLNVWLKVIKLNINSLAGTNIFSASADVYPYNKIHEQDLWLFSTDIMIFHNYAQLH